MKSSYLFLKQHKRSWRLAPPVRSLGFYTDHELLERQQVEWFEISLRFGPDQPRIRTTINGREYETAAPQMVIKRPGDLVFNAVQNVAQCLWISYDAPEFREMCDRGMPDWLAVEEIRPNRNLFRLFRDITSLVDRHPAPGVCERIDLLCLEFLQEALLDATLRERSRIDPAEEGKIRQIAEHFRINFAADLDIDQLLEKYGLSRRSFFRHWKNCFNRTPAQYIFELKMNEACRLLAETDRGLSEIALAVNFGSESYFCGAFRKYTGVTPRQFRLQNRLTLR